MSEGDGQQIPATFLVPDRPGAPLDITFRHEALRMAVVDRDQFSSEVAQNWSTTGVYLLFAPPADDAPRRYGVYVGKAAPGTITARIRSHISNREGWDRALLVTRDAHKFTSTDVGWLEGRLHQILVRAADAELLNATTPGDDTISDWDRQALERVVTLIQGVMRVLGFRPDPDAAEKPDTDPAEAETTEQRGLDTDQLHELISEVQPGEWTTYGDLAEATGSHPRGIGSHIRYCSEGVAPEWRVMNRRGESQPGFTWTTGDRGDRSQIDVLGEEGVAFDDDGRADPDRRVGAEELLTRVGAAAPTAEVEPGGWLRPLYETGKLTAGTRLVGRYKDVAYEATTTKDGEIEATVDGRTVKGSPSHTAGAITGSSVNGWTFWRLPFADGGEEHTLSQLRAAAKTEAD